MRINQRGFRLICAGAQELKKNNVSTVVRVCEPSYKIEEFGSQGITVRDLPFEDGTSPPQTLIDEWFEILKQK